MQESEQELEVKKLQKKETEAEFTKQIAILEANKATNASRIEKTAVEKEAPMIFTEDTDGQNLDDFVRN